MKRKQLALVVVEPEYMRRFADYLRESAFDEQWSVVAFTNVEACRQYIKQGYRLDLICADPDPLRELQDIVSSIHTVMLVSKLTNNGMDNELLKYQSLPTLLHGLFELYSRMARKGTVGASTTEPANGAKIITIYSSSGGVGKSALALHLTHMASSMEQRTFYLNLERWNSTAYWLGSEEAASGEGLSDLLYGIKARSEKSNAWLLENRKRHSVIKGDYLLPWTNVEDRLTLTAEDAVGLVEAISQSCPYDWIIIDLDDGLDELHTSIMELSHQILWVVTDDDSVRSKCQMAMQYGQQKWGERFEKLLGKTKWVRSRTIADHSASAANDTQEAGYLSVSLPEVAEWRSANASVLLTSPAYRAAVRRLYMLLADGGGVDNHAL